MHFVCSSYFTVYVKCIYIFQLHLSRHTVFVHLSQLLGNLSGVSLSDRGGRVLGRAAPDESLYPFHSLEVGIGWK